MPGNRVAPTVIRAELSTDRDATWRALTDPVLVERWFARATPIGAAGDPYTLDFGGDIMRGAILEVVPAERLVYSWGWSETAPDARTRVTWALDAGENGTLVTLTHDGWADAGLGAHERDEHAAHWEEYVAALVELSDELAEGEGA